MRLLLNRVAALFHRSRQHPGQADAPRAWYAPLTPLEAEFAELIAEGLHLPEIRRRLGLSERAATDRNVRIHWKLGTGNSQEIREWVDKNRP